MNQTISYSSIFSIVFVSIYIHLLTYLHSCFNIMDIFPCIALNNKTNILNINICITEITVIPFYHSNSK